MIQFEIVGAVKKCLISRASAIFTDITVVKILFRQCGGICDKVKMYPIWVETKLIVKTYYNIADNYMVVSGIRIQAQYPGIG